MTVGQVVGPLVGAMAAARMGFRPSFVLGAAILLGTAALVQFAVPPPPPARTSDAPRTARSRRDVVGVTLIVLGGSIQVLFLTSILPSVLPPLGVEPARTLEVGGLMMFISGVAAALGSMAAPRLADALPERRLIPLLLACSSLLLAPSSRAARPSCVGLPARALPALYRLLPPLGTRPARSAWHHASRRPQ